MNRDNWYITADVVQTWFSFYAFQFWFQVLNKVYNLHTNYLLAVIAHLVLSDRGTYFSSLVNIIRIKVMKKLLL